MMFPLAKRLGLMADAMVSAVVGPKARFFSRERVDEIVLLLREAEKALVDVGARDRAQRVAVSACCSPASAATADGNATDLPSLSSFGADALAPPEPPRSYFVAFMESIRDAVRDGLAAADAKLTPEQREKVRKFDEILCLVDGGMEPVAAAQQVLPAPPRADALAPAPQKRHSALSESLLRSIAGLVAGERNRWEHHDRKTFEHWDHALNMLNAEILIVGCRPDALAPPATCARPSAIRTNRR